ncbi:unnamed protein product, partial [Rotaria sp. Silwood2]
MAAQGNRRIIIELARLRDLESYDPPDKFIVDEPTLGEPPLDINGSIIIRGRILPISHPFNQAAFQTELKILPEYPFRAPQVRFITPIYHPNVGEDGAICIEILNSAHLWRPTTPLTDVVKAVVKLIDNPDINHALRPDVAAEYASDRATFD